MDNVPDGVDKVSVEGLGDGHWRWQVEAKILGYA